MRAAAMVHARDRSVQFLDAAEIAKAGVNSSDPVHV